VPWVIKLQQGSGTIGFWVNVLVVIVS
jgi:hypothetical protein